MLWLCNGFHRSTTTLQTQSQTHQKKTGFIIFLPIKSLMQKKILMKLFWTKITHSSNCCGIRNNPIAGQSYEDFLVFLAARGFAPVWVLAPVCPPITTLAATKADKDVRIKPNPSEGKNRCVNIPNSPTIKLNKHDHNAMDRYGTGDWLVFCTTFATIKPTMMSHNSCWKNISNLYVIF